MENLIFIGTGFGIVMAVLAALWGVCAVVGTVFKFVETRRKRKTSDVDRISQTVSDQPSNGPPPEHVAAISAAVASLSASYRVLHIHAPAHVATAWAAQGRNEQHIGRRYHTSPSVRGGRRPGRLPNQRKDGSRTS